MVLFLVLMVCDVRKTLEKMHYALVGETSAVQICRWTKNALRGDRGCWKEKFYGVSSAGCCQMTPSVMWCENKCLHCWRPIEMNLGTELPKVDEPIEILDGIVAARKKLLEGFRGRKPRPLRCESAGAVRSASPMRALRCETDLAKVEKAMEPSLYTMSLSGEPTIYPRLGEMFAEIRRRGAVSFLVTNGLNPEVLAGFSKEELPTQITISMNAPNEKLFKVWHRSTKKNAWGKFNESLDVMRSLRNVRRVCRLTLVKQGEQLTANGSPFDSMTNMSEENVLEYCDLIRKAEPDFVHVKGFKSVGYARARMGYDKQPWFEAVRNYAIKICENLNRGKVHASHGKVHFVEEFSRFATGKVQTSSGGLASEDVDDYEIAAEDERCCVVCLKRKGGIGLKIEKC